jgi:presequence protease
MGTKKESFVELTERLGRVTGGVSVSPFTSDVRGSKDPAALLMISGKAMASRAGDLLDVFRDVLLTARLDDKARFRQVTFLPSFHEKHT